MKRIILVLVLALALMGLLLPATVFAADDTGTVSCTVSAALVSVTVTDGSVGYAQLALGATKNTAVYDATNNPNGMVTAQTQTITNTGTVNEDFNMKTSVADGTVDWSLDASTPGSNLFTHAYLVSDTEYSGSAAIGSFIKWATADTYVADAGGSNVAPAGLKYLELEIGMPTGVDDAGDHTITVTVQAVEAGT